jgi:multisubunit Na+/H+ antiporter MnhE subunit
LLLWWIGGTIFWLATTATVTVPEVVVAASAAAVVAVLARVARRAMRFKARPRAAWLAWGALVPIAVAADIVQLVGWLRHPSTAGTLIEQRLPGTDRSEQVGWRAGGMLAISATPGSVVFDGDRKTGRVRIHSLVGGWPHIDRRVSQDTAGPTQ